jgi:hypothetical protein
MIGSILVASILALQGVPASKTPARPATPIAVTADNGPSVEVPSDLAALTGQDTIAVLYLPDAEAAEQIAQRLKDTLGPVANDMPIGVSFRQLVREGVRTDMEIPLKQPVLWWIDLPIAEGDEPPMGMGEFVFRQAIRIPGAEAAMAKAKAEGEAARAADPKARPSMPIRAKGRRGSVTVLKGDIVVVSSDMEPFEMPAQPAPSALVSALPLSAVCGRVDLSRVMSEQGDQLRMLGGFAAMGISGGMEGGPEDKLTDAQRRQRAMKQQLGEAVGQQVDGVVDALMQLKRATFAVSLQGDDFNVWADWSRDAAFPKGLSAEAVQGLCTALPPGMMAYFGISTNAMLTMYGERLQIDDAFANLGATPEQKKAYEDAMAKSRAAIEMIVDGGVGAVSGDLGAEPAGLSAVVAMRVKDAGAFRSTLKGAMADMGRSGLAEVKITEQGDLLTMTITPNAVRVQEIMGVMAGEEAVAEAANQATTPSTIAMRFKGNDVLITQGRGDKVVDPASLVKAGATDLRGSLAAKAWGSADWFGVIELRSIVASGMSSVATTDPKLAASAAEFAKGKPMLIRLWQGVQGGTARLSVDLNMADLKRFVVDMDTVQKSAGPATEGDDDEGDDDDASGDDGT